MRIDEIVLPDGRAMKYRIWDSGNVRGSVHINHGMAEHGERYDEFASFLASHGYVVWIQDHRGHGLNANGKYGYFAKKNGSKLVVDDSIFFDEEMKRMFPGVKHIVIGHSMGSFITRIALSKRPELFDAAVVIGSGGKQGLLGFFGHLVSSFDALLFGDDHVDTIMDKLAFSSYIKGFDEGKSSWISRDEEVRRKYEEDPECGFVCTSSFYNDLITLSATANSKRVIDGTRCDMPILFLSGSEDPVGGKGRGFGKFVSLYSKHMDKVSSKLYHGARHEILNEIGKEEVYSDILSFLEGVVDE